jgi:transcriptional regulator with XRE-family HTH domain
MNASADGLRALQRELGEQLAAFRKAAELSQTALARRVGYSRSAVAGTEAGQQQSSAGFWRRCDEALAANGALVQAYDRLRAARAAYVAQQEREEEQRRDARLADWRRRQGLREPVPTSHAAAPSDTAATAELPVDDVGSEYALHWRDGVEAAAELWRRDVARRTLLVSGFAAVGFATPVMRWLTAGEDAVVGEGRTAVGMPHVDAIRDLTATFRALDNRFGGGHARPAVVSYLDAQVAPLLRNGRYDNRTGRALLAAAAEMTQLAGWMAYDLGAQGLAQRYLVQALRLARAAGDAALGAEILAGMSHQAVYVGQGGLGVDLARAARQAAANAGVPALLAEAAVMEAHGHARRRDERSCSRSLTEAEQRFAEADRHGDPQWIGYFDEAYLSAKFAHCFRDLGRPEAAERFAVRSLDMNPGYARGRVFNLSLLAAVCVQQGEVERAAALGVDAAEMAASMRSARTRDYLGAVRAELTPFAGNRQVDNFLDRTAALSRPSADDAEGSAPAADR